MSGRAGREAALRRALAEAGRRMDARGFAAGSDGNLSARLDEERILITPSGFSKGDLDPEQMLLVSPDGTLLPSFHPARRGLHPSSEMQMHLVAYRRRPDVRAVIHAHPPKAIACTLAALSLERCVLPEIIFHLGTIPTAPYATPGTAEGAAAVEALVTDHDALLLDHHGTLTLGETLPQALMRLEWIEQAAEILLAAEAATGGRVATLPVPIVRRLQELRSETRAAQGRPAGALCVADAPADTSNLDERTVRAITDAVVRRLAREGYLSPGE